MIVDTDVLIWYMRGNQKARKVLDNLDYISISIVSYMELIQGIRNKNELRELKAYVSEERINILPITEMMSLRAAHFMEEFSLSHDLRLADALIAASVSETGNQLLTANTKHYEMITGCPLIKFRPD
ncbi:MAG: hypothetical protein A2161_02620 [Candidatus Schekmanbacteria bacterium RBG_13_48_7]|uniref:PIN domain-containing protein n=1 Tax=Candidatus Schekmanbacteria bacterium RBG_13_48_7 TaxID=1817878 RepID=A0A1F7S2U6_9BACT|nr:MAG: hypothetical protein A2161_02620 [Candidatus Schekmanbacteria bacterium RBG_13_48_7]